MKMYQSLHQSDEESDSKELNFKIKFRMVQNVTQGQLHDFHVMPQIQMGSLEDKS